MIKQLCNRMSDLPRCFKASFLILVLTIIVTSESWSQQCTIPGAFSSVPTIANVATSTLTLSWPGVTSASNYRVYYRLNAGGYLLYSELSSSFRSVNFSSLSPGGSYSFYVQAVKYCIDGEGNPDERTIDSGGVNIIMVSSPPIATNATEITTSSFKANWLAATGADSYKLDVSSFNNFSALVTGYNDLTVPGTSITVSGLLSGTTYYYRVRAVNTSGASTNSGPPISLITVPPAPISLSSNGNTLNSFVANWQTTTGASSYRLDVSGDNFVTFLPGFNNLSVSTISQTVGNLNPGTAYKYRVRAVNASLATSTNSNTIDAKTISVAPDQPNASIVGANSFTINWNTVTGAESYRLDVSVDNSFSTFITGYNSKSVNGLSEALTGLDGGTTYHFRMRAVNAGGISASSLPTSQLTFPDAPQGFVTSDNLSTSIKVSWLAVKSATEYQLQVSTSSSFDQLVAGYSPKVVSPGSTTNFVVTGLASSTIYYFRMVAKNATGTSTFSVTQSASTAPSDGNIPPITFSNLQSPEVHIAGQPQEISIKIIGFGTVAVSFYHKKKAEPSFTKEAVSSTTDTYKVTLSDNWFDKFGMEYYFEAKDLGNPIKRDDNQNHSVLTGVSIFAIPIQGFGKDLRNYQVISFPYALSKARIEDILIPAMKSAYNKKQWRFVQYQNGENVDFLDGLGASDMAQGQGYWFISKSSVDLSFADGKTFGNSVDKPFVLRLKKGWNQIGNPFPYNLSWQDIINANTALTIDKLYVFDKTTLNFIESDALKVFGGGFVFAENAMDIIFPVTLPDKGGRKATNTTDDNADKNSWSLPIQVVQSEVTNTLTGIGMRSDALEGKDKFDKVTPPRFLRYVEFNSKKPSYEFDLSTDVVAPAENYRWSFSVESNSSEPVELKWDKQTLAALDAQVILYDQTKHVLIDMAKLATYTTEPTAKLLIHYRKPSGLEFDKIEFGKPFPNPFTTELTIAYDYAPEELAQAEVTIYDLNGRALFQQTLNSTSSDIKQFSWNGMTQQGGEVQSGMYLYKIKAMHNGEPLVFNGKIIKQ
jgi:Fibronectin type III domain/FlgD Ig-like domain